MGVKPVYVCVESHRSITFLDIITLISYTHHELKYVIYGTHSHHRIVISTPKRKIVICAIIGTDILV